MMNEIAEDNTVHRPFRRAVLRGLGVVLPPLLTIVVFLWAWNLIESYVLVPVENVSRYTISFTLRDRIFDKVPLDVPDSDRVLSGKQVTGFSRDGDKYVRLPTGEFIPAEVYNRVQKAPGEPPTAGAEYCDRYVEIRYLRRPFVVPAFLCVFILMLYGVGKLMAASAGRILWKYIESVIHRLPVIRNVYSSVKQVTDFVFSEQTVEFNRVVAVEYPRKGIWSVGFVTGESMLDIRAAANQPVLTVLMPTSPMPMTGFTITVLKSETVDLNVTVDQAIQFVVSCGVVIPPQQVQQATSIGSKISTAIDQQDDQASDGNGALMKSQGQENLTNESQNG